MVFLRLFNLFFRSLKMNLAFSLCGYMREVKKTGKQNWRRSEERTLSRQRRKNQPIYRRSKNHWTVERYSWYSFSFPFYSFTHFYNHFLKPRRWRIPRSLCGRGDVLCILVELYSTVSAAAFRFKTF